MACDFFTSAASNAVGTLMVDYLVKPIERRLRYLFRFHKIVQELRHQQHTFAIVQTQLLRKVEKAKLQIQTQVIEKYVEDWLRDAENALSDVQSLECRIEENKRCFRWCPNWSWRYRLSKEIEKKTLDITNLVDASKSIEIIGHPAKFPGLEFFTSKGLVASKSSTATFNKIMEALRKDEGRKIGVWGMGGVGKTTLVKEVGNKVEGFDRVIIAVVSRTPDIGEIQNKIADFIDLDFKKKTKEGKAEELWSRLKDGKFLIILDDIWNEWNDEDLRKIGIPLVENGEGCKIILTTRLRKVCESMKCQATVPVDVLDDDEAWTLFKMNAGLEKADPRIIGEAKKVAEECKGLPVAIITLARALKDKTPKGWELARKKLERSRLMEIQNIQEEKEKNAYMCLKISYEQLRDEKSKRCFLLCALYPEDHSIDVEDLVRYAWALELYGKADSIEEVRTQVLEDIHYLKDSCLLLEDEDDERHIKLHDMVRDVALWIASNEESGFMIKSSFESLNESFEPCTAISLLDNEEKNLPERVVCPKLEILLLKNCDAQVTRFQGMQELKVLSLAVADDSMRLVSLYALTSLGKLRALHLENFEDFSFLGNLRTLEILSLPGSGFEGLADELGRLENLKMLDLTRCSLFSAFPLNVIRRLSKLEELYLKGSNIG